MANAQTVLVLGGGVGGLVAAHTLRGSLPAAHRVVLIDREPQHLFQPSLLWLMVGDRKPDQIVRPLDRLAQKGVEVVRGEVAAVDPAARTATVAGRTLQADHLIVALGAELAPDAVPGLAAAGHNFYTVAGAAAFRDALAAFPGGRVALLTATPAYKCPAAPYEAAMLVEAACRKRKIRDRTTVDLFAAEPGPMLVTGADNSRAVRALVEQKGVTYHPEHQVTHVADRTLHFANGETAAFDLLAYVPVHRAPKPVRDAGMCAESGWVAVDRHTLQTRWPQVYAIGDVAGIPLQLGKPLPKAGVFAHGQAEVVARNVAAAILGKGGGARFDGKGECFIETGDGKAGYGSGDFYAEPLPQVALKQPSRALHWAKVAFEKGWLLRWF